MKVIAYKGQWAISDNGYIVQSQIRLRQCADLILASLEKEKARATAKNTGGVA